MELDIGLQGNWNLPQAPHGISSLHIIFIAIKSFLHTSTSTNCVPVGCYLLLPRTSLRDLLASVRVSQLHIHQMHIDFFPPVIPFDPISKQTVSERPTTSDPQIQKGRSAPTKPTAADLLTGRRRRLEYTGKSEEG